MESRQSHYSARVDIKNSIRTCMACPLGEESSNRVPFDGNTWDPELVVMGEAPGANEAIAKKPFIGRAGQLLDSLLSSAGTSRERVVAINTVCCRPPDNRDPEWSEMMVCSVHRIAQTKLTRAFVGLSLGRVALSILRDDPTVTISSHLNRPFWTDGVLWVPTYHPAYAARNPSAKSVIKTSIKTALRYARGEVDPPTNPDWPKFKVVDRILVSRDADISVPKQMSEKYPVFTHAEWVNLQYRPDFLSAAMELRKQGLV